MARELKLVPLLTLRRGLARRCPACGAGGLFRAHFRMRDRCPRCNLLFERIDGQWVGSLGINTMITFTLLFFATIIGVFATAPDVAVGPIIGVTLAIAIVFPAAFFPISRTLWLAIDLLMRPPTDDELDAGAEGVRIVDPSRAGRPAGGR
ncbi:MAG: hypothetical protein AAGD18_16765 [Actinomycetota bacterium]